MMKVSQRICAAACVTASLLTGALPARAQNAAVSAQASAPATNATERAERIWREALAKFQSDTNNAEAAWQLARACFDRAVIATNNSARAEIAEHGIAASRRAVAINPRSAGAHYYLGMNLGQLADTKRNLGALRIVDEMERVFRITRQIDENFDYAGADRNLGLLYDQAPSIISIGSRSKAREHLRRAVTLTPDFPENRLNLIEAYLGWNDRDHALREFKALELLLPAAREKFSGEEWKSSWTDWNARFTAIAKRLGETAKPVESPRHGPD